ncbi:hypothetical protein ACAG39_04575 [Caldicellulosiruptoraceae bacterium PP1]
MIKWFLLYNHKYYMKSYKYVPPFLVFFTILFIAYSIKPVNVMNSYAFTTVLIFFISAWLAYGFIENEDMIQQQITILHLDSQNVYYFFKIIYIWLFSFIFTFIALIYPILLNAFNREITFRDIIISVISHIIASFLGTSIGCFFGSRLFNIKRASVISFIALLLISILGKLIFKNIPHLNFILYIIPPVWMLIDEITKYDIISYREYYNFVVKSFFVLSYSFILCSIFIFIMKKKKF